MKAMISFDLRTVSKMAAQQFFVCVLVGVFIAVMTESLYAAATAIAVMVPLSMSFTLVAFDERADWERFRLALPLSRASVMRGRYASIGLLALAGVAEGLVITGALALVAFALPNVTWLSAVLTDFQVEAYALCTVIGVAITAFLLSFTLPIVARSGMTKTARWLPVVFVLVLLGLYAVGSQFDGDGLLRSITEFAAWAAEPAGCAITCVVIVAASAVLYAASCAVASVLYERREF